MRIAHGALLNLAGHGAPLVAALVAVPALVATVGTERFGFLSLAWALVGYFGLFDLGLGRALARIVAERLGTPREPDIRRLAGSTLTLTLGLGALAGIVLFAAAPWVCSRVLRTSPLVAAEAIPAIQVLAVCLPMVTLSAALRGVLEGARAFGWINAIRVPLGVLTFLAPLAAARSTPDLSILCSVLFALRLLALIAHWYACWQVAPAASRLALPDRGATREVLGFGAWVTVSNVAGALMVYLDRFVIGAQLSVQAVAYYTAPYDVLTRLWVLPAALTGALFPALAAASAAEARHLHRKGVLVLLITAAPLAVLVGLAAPWWMRLWLGVDFAEQGARAAQWLAAGVAVNCLAHVPYTLLQARGRADLPGKLLAAELPFYLVALPALIGWRGIEGAAIAWCARCLVDAGLLFVLASRALSSERP